MSKSSTGRKLDQKLQEINERLKHFGVPFPLSRLGNYRNGEFQIEEVLSVFHFRDFKVTVVFMLREPFSGRLIEYWAQFNSEYSSEALSGHIIVPVVNQDKFLMIRSHGPFIGRIPLVFPRGFIPKTDRNLTAVEVAMSILDRKVMKIIQAAGGQLIGQPRLIRGENKPLALADDHTTSGNLLTVSTVQIDLDETKLVALGRKARNFSLVPQAEFFSYVRSGTIMDSLTLSAYVGYEAESQA